jgi:glycosyltransferase involved in cell wall biosynthesis
MSEPLLFITEEAPFPPVGGRRIREALFIKLLSEKVPVEVLYFRKGNPTQEMPVASLRGLFAPSELANVTFTQIRSPSFLMWGQPLIQALKQRAAPGRLIWFSGPKMYDYFFRARAMGYKIVCDDDGVPRKYLSGADLIVVPTEAEAGRVRKISREAKLQVIPNFVDTPYFEKLCTHQGQSLLFSGSLDYEPNIKGLYWFVEEILPRLRAALREKMPRVVVAGNNPSPALNDHLRSHAVDVRANPSSMLDLIGEAAIVFIPVREGGRTQIKILQAMASGRCVVTTGNATEGLALTPTYDVFVSDQPDSFASDILRLVTNPDLRKEVGNHALKTVKDRYDWTCIGPLLDQLLKGFQRT